MEEINLWESFKIPESAPIPIKKDLSGFQVLIEIEENSIHLTTSLSLAELEGIDNLLSMQVEHLPDQLSIKTRLSPLNAFVLKCVLRGKRIRISRDSYALFQENFEKVPKPHVEMAAGLKHIDVFIPNIDFYKSMVTKLGGWPHANGLAWRMPLAKALDLEKIAELSIGPFPHMIFAKDVLMLNRETISGYDGTLDSLKTIPVSVLNVVNANFALNKSAKGSGKTLQEKMKKFGIGSLHDLLFWLPRRYIDKSKPQDISNLIEGEMATIVGKIASIADLPQGMGVVFEIGDEKGGKVRVTFFRQNWLRRKFHEGDEVLITGKAGWWGKKLQLGGSSIESADEATMLPIVPVYSQSISSGISTYLIMIANRELISRIGEINLPEYLKHRNGMDYKEALVELHFPSSLEAQYQSMETLAYYELVLMQIIIQESREKSASRAGLSMDKTPRDLQKKAAMALPFQLTTSQKNAVAILNRKLKDENPSATLLNADVGAGKTIVAQLGCLRAVDAGYQAVMLGPTDILARQLFATFQKLVASLEEKTGEKVNVAFLGGGMKVAERKPILEGLKNGTIDVLVGTHAVMSSTVEYKSLGFIAIDEQQKFGAEQRSKLLYSRTDGKVPDLLAQTATPIPRSTAQILYGDMDMITLDEKPAGRLPIITEWIKEDPVEFVSQVSNSVLADLQNEIALKHRVFIVAPLVVESEKIDAASVERTFKNLSTRGLAGAKVGFAHGQMKKEDQIKAMADFRDGTYDVLVASTVVEVGVDIPEATRMVILSADRLGASSNHQLRGRVGRNNLQSKCYLVSTGKTENSQVRLQSLVDSENGYDIAAVDLSVRGEGTVFGTSQSGKSGMIFASLSKHGKKIQEAKDEAKEILSGPFRDLALKDARNKFETEEEKMF